jgi:hypothetical protein
MSQKQFYVYIHARPDGSIFYVGKGLKERANSTVRKYNPHHTSIIKKYGKENIIIRKLPCESEQHAFNLEVQMIAILRRMGVKLTNATNGGDGVSGYTPTQKENLKRSASIKAVRSSKESKEKSSISQTLRRKNQADRAKTSNTLKATLSSPEQRLKKSVAAKLASESPEARLKKSLASKEIWKNEEYRTQQSSMTKALWADPEWRERTLAIRAEKIKQKKELKIEQQLSLI